MTSSPRSSPVMGGNPSGTSGCNRAICANRSRARRTSEKRSQNPAALWIGCMARPASRVQPAMAPMVNPPSITDLAPSPTTPNMVIWEKSEPMAMGARLHWVTSRLFSAVVSCNRS